MSEDEVEVSFPKEEDILTILVATDTHVGYGEKDAIRKDDSFNTFEEILQIAHQHKVDMILLGGDLFHDNKPSRRTIHDTISLMRKYCLGDKECNLELISEPAINFSHCDFKDVNYQDPNFNVAYPVFSIHGNHDDPTGDTHLSAIDILSTSGLLNHFGRQMNCDKIEMTPVLLKKGKTRLALYGLGAMRDDRLHRTFYQKKVKMLRPIQEPDSWFNIFAIHQNRAKHGPKNYIPESFLDEFLDLVIWGHEHECLIEPTWSGSAKSFYVSQPGSSVATSLSEGEAKPKFVGILQIHEKSFKMEKVALQTVRQFQMDNIVLAQTDIGPQESEQVHDYLTEKVREMIEEAKENRSGHPKQPELPLIRIKVENSGGYDIINPHRFGQQFVGQVANCKDILLFYKKKVCVTRDQKDGKSFAEDVDVNFSQTNTVKMEDLINEYLNAQDSKLQLEILSERKLSKALNEFVLKDEKKAIPVLVKHQLMKTQKTLASRNLTEESICDEISRLKTEDENIDEKEEDEQISQVLANSRYQAPANFDDPSDGENEPPPERPKRGRGSRGGRVKSTRGRGRGRGAAERTQLTMQQSFVSTASTKKKTTQKYEDDDFNTSKRSQNTKASIELSSDEESDSFSVQLSKRSRRRSPK